MIDGVGIGTNLSPLGSMQGEDVRTDTESFVFSVEPYVRTPESKGGFRLEEHVLGTEDGPEVYSTFPHGPFAE